MQGTVYMASMALCCASICFQQMLASSPRRQRYVTFNRFRGWNVAENQKRNRADGIVLLAKRALHLPVVPYLDIV
jgi:hypothetical protein